MIRTLKYNAESGFQVFEGILPFSELIDSQDSSFWIDFENPTEEESYILYSDFKFHPLIIEDTIEASYPKLDVFKDQRTLIRFNGDESIRAALNLTEVTNRVILATSATKIHTDDPNLKSQLRSSNVKLLTEAKILAVMGDDEVEKAKMLDLDEKSEYDLFIDQLLLLNTVNVPPVC